MRKRHKHNLSHYRLFSCDMGELVPIGCTEVLPGDTFQHNTSLLLRVSPLLAPVMHPVQARIHHWFVPYRLIWEDWEDFITGGPDGNDQSAFPTITLTYGAGPPVTGNNGVGMLADYLGVPPQIDALGVSALPFRAYALIFNEWYRDQDLVTELSISLASGVDSTTNTTMQNCAWEKDYFTSARPWTQKGPEVSIPLTGDAPIKGIGKLNANFGPSQAVRESDGTTPTYTAAQQINPSNADQQFFVRENPDDSGFPGMYADLSQVSAATVNDLRLALALQRFEENRARYGSRYTEYLRYLGITPSDARLQRPEYLGGGKQTIQFSEVLQTAPTEDGDDHVGVGNLKGHGIGALRSNRYRRFFEEHGVVISLMSVRPRTMYVQGLHRFWNKRTRTDYFQEELAHIGQQEIQNQEIYCDQVDKVGVFGYQDRYDEYRRQESGVSGEFRTTELDFWHMARKFAAAPTLNASFVTSNPTKRINAVQTNDVLWCMANHRLIARRQVPKTGRSFIY